MSDMDRDIPGRDEPDPENFRQRPFQGGARGLSEPATDQPVYGDIRYGDGAGPFAHVPLPAGAGSGLSGLPQASAGVVPPLYAETAADGEPDRTPTSEPD